MSAAPLIEVEDLDVSYGPFRALFGVSLSVGEGSAVALVGANGAGKSTLVRAVSGMIPSTGGSIRFAGQDITGDHAYQIARRGMTHVIEGRSVFASLSVEENLVLPFRRALGAKAVPAALDRAYTAFPRLGERRAQSAGTLSGGEQRMLALSRALVIPQKLLLVDELSFGLAPVVVDEVYAALAQVLATGTSLLLVEQHVDRALDLADSAVVLGKGRVLASGTVDEVRPILGELILGTSPA
jgi:branched-chain amino acid transport system ATP-binding protein